jgi:transposase
MSTNMGKSPLVVMKNPHFGHNRRRGKRMEEKRGNGAERALGHNPLNQKELGSKEEAMIREGTFEAIQGLKRRGLKKRKVAEILGLDRGTVRKYWKRAKWESKAGVKRPSLLDPFREHLVTRAAETDYCAQVMFLDIQRLGYAGCYEQVKRFVRPLREERRRFEEATIRFETGPGKQAQVDWGSTWVELTAERVKIHLFVKVLGYSRRIYARAEEDEKLARFLDCHERAFQWFDGLTASILYDNPKTVCLTRDFEGCTSFSKSRHENRNLPYGLGLDSGAFL